MWQIKIWKGFRSMKSIGGVTSIELENLLENIKIYILGKLSSQLDILNTKENLKVKL